MGRDWRALPSPARPARAVPEPPPVDARAVYCCSAEILGRIDRLAFTIVLSGPCPAGDAHVVAFTSSDSTRALRPAQGREKCGHTVEVVDVIAARKVCSVKNTPTAQCEDLTLSGVSYSSAASGHRRWRTEAVRAACALREKIAVFWKTDDVRGARLQNKFEPRGCPDRDGGGFSTRMFASLISLSGVATRAAWPCRIARGRASLPGRNG